MNNRLFNSMLLSIFFLSILIFLVFIIGILNNRMVFSAKDSVYYFDIVGKIAVPTIAVFVAIYYSTLTSNFQRISALRSLLADLSDDRYKITDAVRVFIDELNDFLDEIESDINNGRKINRNHSKLFDAIYSLKRNISSKSSALYMNEFKIFREKLSEMTMKITDILKIMEFPTNDNQYKVHAQNIYDTFSGYQEYIRNFDRDIYDEIERLKDKYTEYTYFMFK